MLFILRLRCCTLIFAILFPVNSVFGGNWKPETCVPHMNSNHGNICQHEFPLRGKTIKLPCIYDNTRKGYVEWFQNGHRMYLPYDQIRQDKKDNSLIIENVDFRDNAIYTCKLEGGHQAYELHSIVLEVQSLPYFMHKPQNVNVVLGKTAKIECEAGGAPIPAIKWLRDGQELNGPRYEISESGNLQIRDVRLQDDGEYTCGLTNTYGSVNATARLVVNNPTKITEISKDQELDVGDTAIFECYAKVDPALKLRIDWLKNRKVINVESEPRIFLSTNSSVLKVIQVRESDEATYTCVASTGLDEARAQTSLAVHDVPKPPTLLGVDCGTKEAQLSWNATSDNHWPITHYSIEYNTDFTPYTWQVAEHHIPSRNHSYIVKLTSWANYTFRVIAWNKMGPSEPSSHSFVCTTSPDVPYKNPDVVKAETKNLPSYHIRIDWTLMPQIEHNAPNFVYRIYYKLDLPGQNWTVKDIRDMRVNFFRIFIGASYDRYKIKVVAANEMGESREPPQEIDGFFGEDKPQQAPGNFTVEKKLYSTTALLSWTKVPDETVRGRPQGYLIETWTENDGKKSNQRDFHTYGANATSISIDKLIPGNKYFTRVRVRNGRFSGPFSEVIVIDTPNEETVTDFEVSTVGSTTMLLKWSKPTTVNGTLMGYNITFEKANVSMIEPKTEKHLLISNPEVNSTRLSGLCPQSIYRITIRAVTSVGEGEPSLLHAMTRAPKRPGKPIFNLQKIPKKNGLTNLKIVRDMKPEDLLESYFFVEYRMIEEDIRMKTHFERQTNEIMIPSLERGHSYIVYVIAVDGGYFTESDPQVITI